MKNLNCLLLQLLPYGITGVQTQHLYNVSQDDFVGISLDNLNGYVGCYSVLFMERNTVAPGWKTSVTVAGLVTGIAFIHYMYMREVWVMTGDYQQYTDILIG